MNSIQQAMRAKAHKLCGCVEHEIDKFLDNKYKSSFNMVKYLTQLDLKSHGETCSERILSSLRRTSINR